MFSWMRSGCLIQASDISVPVHLNNLKVVGTASIYFRFQMAEPQFQMYETAAILGTTYLGKFS